MHPENFNINKYVFVFGTSRTGTTLMTTVLDSHPLISMGYELPAINLPSAEEIATAIDSCLVNVGNNAKACAVCVRSQGYDTLGKFIIKCQLSCITPKELVFICQSLARKGCGDFSAKDTQFALAMAVVNLKCQKEGNSITGFKLATASVEDYYDLLPEGYFICMIRDPRDVFASLEANNFGREIEGFTRSWNNFVRRYLDFHNKHPKQTQLVQYESLVTSPEKQLKKILGDLGLDYCDEVRNFFQSKASVHQSSHMNAKSLKQDFFVTSISRWKQEISSEQVAIIETNCKKLMTMFGYL